MGARRIIPAVRTGNWESIRKCIDQINFQLGIESSPKFGSLTITDDMSIGGNLAIAGDLSVVGAANLHYIDFDLTPTCSGQEGRMFWNSDDGTVNIGMPGGNVTLQVGQEEVFRCKNAEADTLTNGTVVYISGSTGDKPEVKRANADNVDTSYVFGVVTEDIAPSQFGYVTTSGNVRDIDTDGFSYTNPVWLDTTDGLYTQTQPTSPNMAVRIGHTVRAHATEGILYIRPIVIPKLPSLSDVYISLVSNNQFVLWNNSNSRWENGDINTLIAGTSNQVIVTDDGDATLTLSTPQDIHTGASPTFADLTLSSPSSIYALSHDSFADFVAGEHFLQTAITNVSTALSTGLLKVTTGTGALSVITDNSSNWDTAYGWGDHSLIGYLTDIAGESIGDLSDVDLTDIADDKILQYNSTSTNWECVDIPAGYSDEEAQDAVGTILADSSSIDFTYTDATPEITAVVLPAGVDHDSLNNFVANEHIDHTSVTLTASTGLSGGGDISANRSFSVDINGLTEDTSPDQDADFVMTYDTSAATLKKVQMDNRAFGGDKIGCKAYLSGDQTANNATLYKITMDTVDYDTDSAFDTVNNKYVCPEDGLYHIMLRVRYGTNTVDGGEYNIRIYVNGVQQQATTLTMGNGGAAYWADQEVHFVKQLSASDYIEAYGRNNSGTNCYFKGGIAVTNIVIVKL